MMQTPAVAQLRPVPRLGFLGLGWIGLARMRTLVASGAGCVAAIADTSAQRREAALAEAPETAACDSLDQLLEQPLDGIVIATPSALHAAQAIRALQRGIPVFCQKPLARTAAENASVIAAARAADRLLGVDLSYRFTAAMRAVRDVVQSGSIGDVFAVDLTFHNAYGPDKGWARDPALAGGGCVIDLGIHLVDLAVWVLDAAGVKSVDSILFERGRRLRAGEAVCEDFATATIELDTGTAVRLACSWEMHAGRGAIIETAFHGTRGSAVMRNVDGSFFDFVAEECEGASTTMLAAPPDDWPGRALIDWSNRVALGGHYDASIEALIPVAATLDRVLGR